MQHIILFIYTYRIKKKVTTIESTANSFDWRVHRRAFDIRSSHFQTQWTGGVPDLLENSCQKQYLIPNTVGKNPASY